MHLPCKAAQLVHGATPKSLQQPARQVHGTQAASQQPPAAQHPLWLTP
jgi:hypothetical protein